MPKLSAEDIYREGLESIVKHLKSVCPRSSFSGITNVPISLVIAEAALARGDEIAAKKKEQSLDLPDSLEPCREQICEWIKYKRERHQAYKPIGLKALIKKLEKWGADKSVAAIQQSMENNWAGLFVPKDFDGRKVAVSRCVDYATIQVPQEFEY